MSDRLLKYKPLTSLKDLSLQDRWQLMGWMQRDKTPYWMRLPPDVQMAYSAMVAKTTGDLIDETE
jgi:hypothetical protein